MSCGECREEAARDVKVKEEELEHSSETECKHEHIKFECKEEVKQETDLQSYVKEEIKEEEEEEHLPLHKTLEDHIEEAIRNQHLGLAGNIKI